MLRFAPLAVAIGVLLSGSALAAAPVADAGNATDLPGVQVTGVAPGIDLNIPGTVSTIDRVQMDRHLIGDIRQLVKYEPGVSVVGSGGRFGLDSFNVRGLSGNRTRIEIDGVPMPASFGAEVAGGSFRAGRDFIDLDEIEQVRIVRGPASALYPSDALGGVVSLATKDPTDYLVAGKHDYTALKEQYDGSDRSLSSTLTLAGGDARNGLLFVASHADGHETQNQGEVGGSGATRTRPNPQTWRLDSFLGKYVHTADSGRVDRVTLSGSQRRTHTDSLSDLNPAQGTSYYRSQDENMQARVSIGQWFPRLDTALADTLEWQAYWQKSRTRTNTQTDAISQDFSDPGTPVARYFQNLPLQEKVAGGRVLAVKHLGDPAGLQQTLSYGVELSRTNAQSSVDGYGIDLLTGARGNSIAFLPGNYPLHLIPSSNTYRYALFGQDEWVFAGGRFTLTPGLRADRYAYKPQDDALYLAYNPGFVQSNYQRNHVSPKLGALWRIDDTWSAYANFDYGFRPPLYSEIGGAWNEQPYPGINIAFLPDPALKAETSRGAELGFRGRGEAGWLDVDGYFNAYRNFIWSGYALPASQVPAWAKQMAPGAFYNAFFQAVNTRRAFIKGVEASGALRLGWFGDALQGWSLKGSAALTTGRLIQPGDSGYSPLNTVDPAKLVLGIGYDAERWGAELDGTGVRRHTRLSDPSAFRPAGYATLDLYAHYAPFAWLTLYAGVSNLADRKYWDWGSLNGGALGNLISGNGVNDSGLGGVPADRLSMPGRTFSAAAKIVF